LAKIVCLLLFCYFVFLTCVFCTVDEDHHIETEPQLNTEFLISTPKSSKKDSRQSERGLGFLRGLMDLFR